MLGIRLPFDLFCPPLRPFLRLGPGLGLLALGPRLQLLRQQVLVPDPDRGEVSLVQQAGDGHPRTIS